jgi:hypothetical protein
LPARSTLPLAALRRAALLLVITMAAGLGAVVTSCGDDGVPECHRPADCVTVPAADTCKMVKGHGQCVLACAMSGTQDSCPAPYHCTATADDGTTYCLSKP